MNRQMERSMPVICIESASINQQDAQTMVVEGGVEEDLHQILVQTWMFEAFHSTFQQACLIAVLTKEQWIAIWLLGNN